MKKIQWFLIALMFLALPFESAAMTITFDELGTGSAVPVSGLSLLGVNFGFMPYDQAIFNGAIGGGTLRLQDPVMVGDTEGVLWMSFPAPSFNLEFDLSLMTMADINRNPGPAYIVALSTGSNPVAYLEGSTTAELFYSEDHFAYSGDPFDRVDIMFYNGQDPLASPGQNVTQFAIDNLTFDGAVPEPLTSLLTGAGLIGLALLHRRMRHI